MEFDLAPYNMPFNLELTLKSSMPSKVLIIAKDIETNEVYIERKGKVLGQRKFVLKFPLSPNRLRILVRSAHTERSDVWIHHIKVRKVRICPVDLSTQDKRFMGFAGWFSKNADKRIAADKGVIYKKDGFQIIYVNRVHDQGQPMTTPAVVGNTSGNIIVAKHYFKDYTVPMRMCVLMHEYAHKFKNPEYGRKVQNEISADLISVHMLLALGYSQMEILYCYAAIFSGRDNKENRSRFAAIEEYIEIFTRGELKACA